MVKSKPLFLAAVVVIVALGWQLTRQNKDGDTTTSTASLETTPARTTNGTRPTDAGSRHESRQPRPLATQAAGLPDGGDLDSDLPNRHLARMADKLLNDPVVLSVKDFYNVDADQFASVLKVTIDGTEWEPSVTEMLPADVPKELQVLLVFLKGLQKIKKS